MSQQIKIYIILLMCLQLLTAINGNPKTVFCYWGTWSHYRPGDGKFEVANIDPSICTHLGYAFFGITDTGAIRLMDSWLDVDLKNIEKAIALKQQNHNLKVLASVGGWNEGSAKYSSMAGDATKRATFITSAVSLLEKYGFDGVDLDWEYPAQRGGSAADHQNYVTLLRELNTALKAHHKLLTVAVAGAKSSAEKSYDIRGMSQHVDLINLMTYDLHGSWDNVLGHNAPLQGDGELTVSACVNYWLRMGAPASKIVVGIPFYGRTFTMTDPSKTNVGSPSSGPGIAGPYTREAGYLGYNEICMTVNSWNQEWDGSALAPYAYKGNQWVGYDNIRSINEKLNFIKKYNLAGAMVWSIETDDFLGKCGAKYPLLHAINTGLREDNTIDSTPAGTSKTNFVIGSRNECVTDGYFRNEQDCGSFYICTFGRLFDFACPNGLYFDENTKTCNWKYVVDYIVFCYWGTWSHYRDGDGKFQVDNIDPSLCTHLAYAFFVINDAGFIEVADTWLDIGTNNIEKVIALKQKNYNLKVLASVGGWKVGSAKYSSIAGNGTKRANFITSAVNLLQKYGFDGVDLDWEYPAQRGGSAADLQNYVTLLRELSTALKAHHKLLTVAVAGAKSSAEKSYDISGMSQHVDLINLMTYDLHGSWDNVLGHNAPLYGDGELTVSACVNYWLRMGAPASKIVVGIPFYGRTFTMADPSKTNVGSRSSGPGIAGPYTREAGYLGYNEICMTVNSWEHERDRSALVPYAYKDNQWLSYDDVHSVKEKVNFIKNHNLVGVMVWSIETDDFLGKSGVKFPLLRAINM